MTAPSPPDASPSAPRLSVSAIVPALALGLLWFVLCRHLSSEWSLNEQYSYGWFVPFFAAYLFWLRWEDRPQLKVERRNSKGENDFSAARPQTRFLLSTFTFLLLAALLPLRLFEIGNPDWRPLGWVHAVIVVALTLAVIWRLGGTRWLLHFAFPVCFIFIAVPWISAVEFPIIQGLMGSVAAVAAETLNLFGIPAQLEGNLIRVSSGLVGVNEACSGVRSLQTSLMIGLLFGELRRFSASKRLLLVAGAAAIAYIANCVRALFLVWIAADQEPNAVAKWHDLAGYSIVAAVFIGTMALAAALSGASRVEREREKGEDRADPGPTSDSRPLTFDSRSPSPRARALIPSPFRLPTSYFILALSWLVASEAAVEGWYRFHERSLIPVAQWTAKPPETIAGFRHVEVDERVRATLRFDQGWQGSWPLQPGSAKAPGFIAFFFRWNAGGSSVVRARSHRPDICLPSAGWEQIADHGTTDYAVGELRIPFRHITFRPRHGTAIAYTFFCLQEDLRRPKEARPDLQLATGRQPDWAFAARARAVREGVRNLGQQVLEIVIVTEREMERTDVEQRFRDVLQTIVQPANQLAEGRH